MSWYSCWRPSLVQPGKKCLNNRWEASEKRFVVDIDENDWHAGLT